MLDQLARDLLHIKWFPDNTRHALEGLAGLEVCIT
jgi:hypothetical protein